MDGEMFVDVPSDRLALAMERSKSHGVGYVDDYIIVRRYCEQPPEAPTKSADAAVTSNNSDYTAVLQVGKQFEREHFPATNVPMGEFIDWVRQHLNAE